MKWLSRFRERKSDEGRQREIQQKFETKEIQELPSEPVVAEDGHQYFQPNIKVRMLLAESRWLEQKYLIRALHASGIEIPREKMESVSDGKMSYPYLSFSAVPWARRTLSEYRRAQVKDWIAILAPILSLIASTTIAILGLLVALKKR